MVRELHEFYMENRIELYSAIDFEHCSIIAPHKLSRAFGERTPKSVLIFAIPYLSRSALLDEGRNVSLYAAARDYHVFSKNILSRLCSLLECLYTEYRFLGFSDNSPIDERKAAKTAGIGTIGDNGLILTKPYSSFVFLAEVISDMPAELYGDIYSFGAPAVECLHCGACLAVCPKNFGGTECLSSLTQKKGVLSKEEQSVIVKQGSAWGCDLCQLCCPITKEAIARGSAFSDIEYFNQDIIPSLSADAVVNMQEEEFASRAYSWRGRECVLRNLKLLDGGEAE